MNFKKTKTKGKTIKGKTIKGKTIKGKTKTKGKLKRGVQKIKKSISSGGMFRSNVKPGSDQKLSEQVDEIVTDLTYEEITNDIINNFYLCTQTRHDKPIEILRPFGKLDEVLKIYGKDKSGNPIADQENYSDALKEIVKYKEESDKITDVKILGTSQFGLYFRFVEKRLIDNFGESDNTNSIQDVKHPIRSFVFDIQKLLTYITQFQTSIPLCWYSPSNRYGYQTYGPVFKKNIENFIGFFGKFLRQNLNNHEFVCRMPIPLKKESGFIKKINRGIL
jgi:hypothetical protein